MPPRSRPDLLTVTVLFTDIVDSTVEWERSREMSQRVERHFAVLRAAVAAEAGEVFATLGDGIAAAFTSIGAALHAATTAQEGLPDTGLAVRMGIHTGEVERVGSDLRGRSVNRAARVMGAAGGGQIVLSDTAATLVRQGPDPIELVDLGPHRLKGLADPERLWLVGDGPPTEASGPTAVGAQRAATGAAGPPTPARPALPVSPVSLPRTSFVGRDTEVRRIVAQAETSRLLTLTGVGGVGKTRLGLHAAAVLAEHQPVAVVKLAGISDPALAAAAVGSAAGLDAAGDPFLPPGARLVEGRGLLVVDCCEHVLDAVATTVDDLLEAAPDLTVLATSREPLGVDGEFVVPVRPLPLDDAVTLFRARAAAAGADLDEADLGSLVDACRRLDGLPLAIELVASSSATVGLASHLAPASHRLGPLDARAEGREPRQATLRASFDWSYQLLDHDERRLLRALAASRDGVDLDRAAHVGAAVGLGRSRAIDLVSSLVRKSLLVPDHTRQVVRFKMLDTVRDLAGEQLDQAGERGPAQAAHADWVAGITDRPAAEPCSEEVQRATLALEDDVESWREAVAHAVATRDRDLLRRLCGPPALFFLLGRHELADVVRPALSVITGSAPDDEATRAVLCGLIVTALGPEASEQLGRWTDRVEAIDAASDAPSGLGSLMRWLVCVSEGAFEHGVAVSLAAARDPRLAPTTRDLFVGMAASDTFSILHLPDTEDLVPTALAVAERSRVPLTRALCRLGAGWGLADADPERSVQLVRLALDDLPRVPSLLRLTLPGNALRLLARVDPRLAAEGLLERVGSSTGPESAADLIPLVYAADVLQGLGRPVTASLGEGEDDAAATYDPERMTMVDAIERARRAYAARSGTSYDDVEETVRTALSDVAADDPG